MPQGENKKKLEKTNKNKKTGKLSQTIETLGWPPLFPRLLAFMISRFFLFGFLFSRFGFYFLNFGSPITSRCFVRFSCCFYPLEAPVLKLGTTPQPSSFDIPLPSPSLFSFVWAMPLVPQPCSAAKPTYTSSSGPKSQATCLMKRFFLLVDAPARLLLCLLH